MNITTTSNKMVEIAGIRSPMIKNPFITLIAITLLCSCTSEPTGETAPAPAPSTPVIQNPEFERYLSQFETVRFPVTIRGCASEEMAKVRFDHNNPGYNADEDYAGYGKFKMNDSVILVITLGYADCYIPEITTYSHTGDTIASKSVYVGQCGPDPCYECEMFMSLSSNFELYTSDTTVRYECDDDYNAVSGTGEKKVHYKTGKIMPDGKITLSEEQEKQL